jgi:DNA-binding transcriptional MerR regulator
MTDPIVILAATEILKLAFNEFIKTSAGETAKKLTGEAFTKADELRQRIVSWFQDKQDLKAVKAITAIQEQGSLEALNKLATYLDDEMKAEPIFAQDLQHVSQQIVNIQSLDPSNRQYNNFGRDMINIEHIQGDPRIGGS